jgi:8-oxo-dGTP pyrophosphatase MutT (NUDIX family)
VPFGQSPWQSLLREAWEEAGLDAAVMQHATCGRTVRLARDVAEGHQHEWLYVWDLELPAATLPANQDGEVAGFRLLPLADALQVATGGAMTVDASLVTLDFVLRRALLPSDDATALAAAAASLWVPSRGHG